MLMLLTVTCLQLDRLVFCCWATLWFLGCFFVFGLCVCCFLFRVVSWFGCLVLFSCVLSGLICLTGLLCIVGFVGFVCL